MAEDISLQSNFELNRKDMKVIVSVNPKIYPLDVTLSAAYLFTEKYYVYLDGDPQNEIQVEFRQKAKDADIEKVARDFNNELINYATYAVQVIKNEKLREAIITRVMMTNSAAPEKPWNSDPEGIAVPWDEKYGKK
jgi:His-Xaa-Ser system protein HxsD